MKRANDPFADTVIAKSVSYAGWFSLGDTFRGEKALVLYVMMISFKRTASDFICRGDGSGNLVVKG